MSSRGLGARRPAASTGAAPPAPRQPSSSRCPRAGRGGSCSRYPAPPTSAAASPPAATRVPAPSRSPPPALPPGAQPAAAPAPQSPFKWAGWGPAGSMRCRGAAGGGRGARPPRATLHPPPATPSPAASRLPPVGGCPSPPRRSALTLPAAISLVGSCSAGTSHSAPGTCVWRGGKKKTQTNNNNKPGFFPPTPPSFLLANRQRYE